MSFHYIQVDRPLPDEDWRIAVHESGHAVVAVQSNGFLKRNSDDCLFNAIEIGPGEFGQVDFEHSPLNGEQDESWSLDLLQYWQTIYAAGAAAEHLVFGEIRMHGVRPKNWATVDLNDRRDDMALHEKIGQKVFANFGLASEQFDEAVERGVEQMRKTSQKTVSVAEKLFDNSDKNSRLKSNKSLNYEQVCELVGVVPSWCQ